MTNKKLSPVKYFLISAAAYALIFAVILLVYRQYQNREIKPTENQARLHEVSKALDLYYQDCKTFPTVEQGFNPLLSKPESEPLCEKWDGPYLDEEDLVDNEGHAFVYTRDEEFYSLELANPQSSASQQ